MLANAGQQFLGVITVVYKFVDKCNISLQMNKYLSMLGKMCQTCSNWIFLKLGNGNQIANAYVALPFFFTPLLLFSFTKFACKNLSI